MLNQVKQQLLLFYLQSGKQLLYAHNSATLDSVYFSDHAVYPGSLFLFNNLISFTVSCVYKIDKVFYNKLLSIESLYTQIYTAFALCC